MFIQGIPWDNGGRNKDVTCALYCYLACYSDADHPRIMIKMILLSFQLLISLKRTKLNSDVMPTWAATNVGTGIRVITSWPVLTDED